MKNNDFIFSEERKIIKALYQFFFYIKKEKKFYNLFLSSLNKQKIEDKEFIKINEIIKKEEELVAIINKFLKRDFYQQFLIEQAILIYGAYYITVPSKNKIDKALIINFCIEYAKKYSSERSYKIINFVLDKVGKDV